VETPSKIHARVQLLVHHLLDYKPTSANVISTPSPDPLPTTANWEHDPSHGS
jgi:hypothetical protein